MPLDAICINALVRELAQDLEGARIDKVQQPSKDLLILGVHGGGGGRRLLISAGAGSARVHFTEESFENPQSPPMFCMLLRKHLVGSRISSVSQPDFERMIVFELNAFDDMGVPVKKRLIVELMGRSTNIILVGSEGHIIDAIRRVDGDMGRRRQVLPGLLYHYPEKQEKPCFLELSSEEISAVWQNATGEKDVDKWLFDSFAGLSPLICRELCFRAAGETSKPLLLMDEGECQKLRNELITLRERVEKGSFEPTMVIVEDRPQDFTFMPIRQYENAASEESFPGFSELLESFYSKKERREQMRRKSQALMKSVRSAHERAVRKLAARRQELEKTGERDLNRKRGDLITASLYKLKKGDRLLETEDYFEEGSPSIEITLDPLKTPQQNAAFYYREYNKAKTAEKYLGGLIEQGEKEEAYLASVMDEITRAESERDLTDIRRELTETGFIRQQKAAKKEKIKESSPMRFLSSADMEILVGKNNVQNDRLTTKTARRSDMWLHIQKLHGSHVVISCGDGEPDEGTLREAASLAVYFSEARESGKAAVDYTRIRYVKKPPGAMPGAVIYTDYKTVIAQPDEMLAEKLRVK